jgi:general secretion pathway protein F
MTIPAGTAHIDDLIAINREIAALVRAGIPLELGLRTFANGLPGRLGRLSERIANRLQAGSLLSSALQEEVAPRYPVYAAMIDAGLQSGRLPEALEAIAASAELTEEMRRFVRLALVYPTVLCVLSYALLVFFATAIVPFYVSAAIDFGFGDTVVFQVLKRVHETAGIWTWLIPVVAIVIYIASRILKPMGLWRVSSISQLLHRAQFVELLKLQVDHNLPLAPAFRRAADGSGDPGLRRVADTVCRDVESGMPFSEAIQHSRGLPPMMQWILATAGRQGTLVASLELMRDSFRRRAEQRAQLIKTWLPALLTLTLGGTVVLLYGLMFFIPMRAFWDGLMHE